MKHLELKKQLLTNDLDKIKLFDKAHKLQYIGLKNLRETGDTYNLELSEQVLATFTEQEAEACYQLNHAKYARKVRLQDYIELLLNKFDKVYFLTLTFSDKYINSSDETKRKYVTRALKNLTPYYIANVDYGKEFGRLHYHAITTQPLTQDFWKYGFINCQEIRNTATDAEKVAKYCVKFSNHALKDTNKTKKCLYSKALKDLK